MPRPLSRTGPVAASKAVFLLLATAALCIGTACETQRWGAETGTSTGEMRWQPWRGPEDAPLSAAQGELQADLTRHVETSLALPEVRRIRKTFPLAGSRLEGRTFWAALVKLPGSFELLIVYERIGRGWREVARDRMDFAMASAVAPVHIEPQNAWVFTWGSAGMRGIPLWHVLRFDGESLQREASGNWWSIMLVDLDLDGVPDILGKRQEPALCFPCRSVEMRRWNGVEMTRVSLEALPAGSASATAVAANNRAVELAAAGRWTEARGVVDVARGLMADSPVFRRNAALIDINAPRSVDISGLGPDAFLRYVLSGSWSDAVDAFRHTPILPDFFANKPRHVEEFDGWWEGPYWGVVFGATARARRVAPALAEIEFLHAWSAYHLDSDPGGTVALEGLDRAAALSRSDPLFVEALRFVRSRADVVHADAMRRTFLLFDAGACAGPGCTEPPLRPEATVGRNAVQWRTWRAPIDAGRRFGMVEGGPELLRQFAAVYRGDSVPSHQVTAFPLVGERFGGRLFWAVFHRSADWCRAGLGNNEWTNFSYRRCTGPALVVYERRDGGWRQVAHHRARGFVSAVAPVEIEPSQAWIAMRRVYDTDPPEQSWQILRFDGESLHVEFPLSSELSVDGYSDVMIADIDGNGALEILSRRTLPFCSGCPVTRRGVRLYRWDGTRMAAAPLEMLPAGSAAAAAVAANNRVVALARAQRWMEAAAVVEDLHGLVDNPVFRRNASLIELNAGTADGDRLSEDTLLHHVFAGAWTQAVDLFRGIPVGRDLFAEASPYRDASGRLPRMYGTLRLLRVIFDATAAARAVAPARPEIEFLHAWSAFHLDPDTTGVPSSSWQDAVYRIDVDESAVLEVFDRAVALAPDDPLFAEARRFVMDPSRALRGEASGSNHGR